MNIELKELALRMEAIAGEWNGDESGLQEERAGIATEVLKLIEEINNLVEAL